METRPPNFRGRYPLAGEKIGPAWSIIWRRLSRNFYTDGLTLAGDVTQVCDVAPRTVLNLLTRARALGILEVTYRVPKGRARKTAHYRVSMKGAEMDPGWMPGTLKAWLWGGRHTDDPWPVRKSRRMTT
jgi:hypothetical protein